MGKLKQTINIVLGSVILYLSILFLAIGLDFIILALAGLMIAPAFIIYFTKKLKVKSLKLNISLIAVLLVSLVVSASIMPDTSSVAKKNNEEIVAAGKEEKQETKLKEEKTNSENEEEIVKNAENTESESSSGNEANSKSNEDLFQGYKLIEVDGGDLSGNREPNVVVDIGFGDREYYAFTNENGQLVKVVAKAIIVQDDSKEPVTSDGRYYPDEAKVPGVESSSLDEGHVIADSLGGVSNAYNITPQNSTLNRHGDQAYLEKAIRDAGGCTDFVAIITYPNTTTQIPSHYSFTYTINGNVINDEFDNINPDEYNASLDLNESTDTNTNTNTNTDTNATVDTNTAMTSDSSIVYWTPRGTSYHTTKDCSTLSRSKTILEGTLQESGKTDPCDVCH